MAQKMDKPLLGSSQTCPVVFVVFFFISFSEVHSEKPTVRKSSSSSRPFDWYAYYILYYMYTSSGWMKRQTGICSFMAERDFGERGDKRRVNS